MTTIKVINYIKSGFSPQDAEILATLIQNKLKMSNRNEVLQFDFSNVKFFTTLFFNVAFTGLLKKMSFEEYDSRIQLVNLSEVGQIAYKHSLDNAKRFAAMSETERDRRKAIIEEILNEE